MPLWVRYQSLVLYYSTHIDASSTAYRFSLGQPRQLCQCHLAGKGYVMYLYSAHPLFYATVRSLLQPDRRTSFHNNNTNLHLEIIRPGTELFVKAQFNFIFCVYFSNSMLLRGATALADGGTLCGDCFTGTWAARYALPPPSKQLHNRFTTNRPSPSDR